MPKILKNKRKPFVFYLPSDLHRKTKVKAAQMGVSMSVFAELALIAGIGAVKTKKQEASPEQN